MERKQSMMTTLKSQVASSVQRWLDLPAGLPAQMPAAQTTLFLTQSHERHYHVTITFDAPPTLLQARGYVRPFGEKWLFVSDDHRLYRVFEPGEVYSLQRVPGTAVVAEAD